MRLWRDAASQRLRRVRVEVALGLVVLVLVSACSPVPGVGNEDALSTVVGSNTALPEVPDADLTVVMSPGGDVPTDIGTEGVIRDSVVILATFPTNAGPGYIARYRSTDQNNCSGATEAGLVTVSRSVKRLIDSAHETTLGRARVRRRDPAIGADSGSLAAARRADYRGCGRHGQ